MQKAIAEIGIRRYARAPAAHAHAHSQLVLPLEGRLEMEIEAGAGAIGSRVGDGRAAVIPGGRWHSFLGLDAGAFLVVDLPDETGPANPRHRLWQAAGERPFLPVGAELAGHLAFLAATARAAPITGLAATVAGTMILDALARGQGLAPAPLPGPVGRAVRLIESCAAAPLTVADLARAAGASPSRLHALFRAATGRSPMRYLAAERVRRAMFLLETTDAPVARIAQEVGYADQSAFARAFRRETGRTPAEHRARLREFRHNLR